MDAALITGTQMTPYFMYLDDVPVGERLVGLVVLRVLQQNLQTGVSFTQRIHSATLQWNRSTLQ